MEIYGDLGSCVFARRNYLILPTMLTVVIFALLPMKIVGRKLSDIHDWFKLSIKSIWI